jgi:hypothetical protein
MATPSKGLGRGAGSGGQRPKAGRPLGALNHHSRAMVAQARRNGDLMPLDFLLQVVRTVELPLKERIVAAGIAVPFCSARLSLVKIVPDPTIMDDTMLAIQTERWNNHLDGMPEAERCEKLTEELQDLIEKAQQLSRHRQEELCGKLIEAGRNFVVHLAESESTRPGAVPPATPRPNGPQKITRPR